MIRIDVDTRCWQIPKEEYFLGVESDDKVKILQFELSKNEFCDGLNFTDCNCFINYKNEDNDTIPYGITDMEVHEDGTVTFTWKVSRGATIFKGNTFAVLCAKKVREDGTITNEWNSRIGSFTVSKGLEPSSSIVEVPEIDIISQLLLVAQHNIDQSSSLLEKAEGLGYLKEDFDVLKARMDQFTSLQEGSTTGDAELIDGRIGYDGTVYGNIGGAIREQVSELKGDLAANTSNITKNANDIKTLQEDLSSVGQQADANKEEIANLTTSVNEKFLASGLGILRTGKLYGTKVWKSAVNNSQTLEKTYDNAGLVCVPSTDTTVRQDDYSDIPLFQWVRCTYKRYDDGFAYPIAVESDSNYSEEGNVDCGSLMRTFYYKEIDNDDYTEVIISDSPNHALGLKPWEQAVRADGTVMPYFINSRYHSIVGTDGKLYSNRGRISRFQSHNNMITNYQKKGAGYWGAGSDRYTLAQIMMFIKYGTKSIQKVMAGVTNHNVQIKASIQSEEANTYFPVTNSQANSILVGTRFSVGYGTFNSSGTINVDRGNGTIHAYADDVVVTAKVPMDDGVNTAIYLDCTAFNTMPITDSNGHTSDIYITSMHAWSGDTDSVIGHHDGSPVSNTDGKHPCRIQGIEFMMGGYTVASDTVMFFKSDYSKDVYVAHRGVAHSTSDSTIQSTYTLVGNIPANNGADFWIGDVNHVNGVWYPSTVVSSDQYGMGDRCYAGGQATSGSREYLQGGYLWSGSSAGLSCLRCGDGLGGAVWNSLSAD